MTMIDATVRPRLRILGTVALRPRASLKLREVRAFSVPGAENGLNQTIMHTIGPVWPRLCSQVAA
jgi:hypothetical protein